MAFPQTPLPVTVHLLTTDTTLGPVDVTADVLVRDGISIRRGRSPESRVAEPSSCGLTMRNASGAYSPGDPTGSLFGHFRNGATMRVGLVPSATTCPTVTDTFGRVVASGWGTATSGQAWTIVSVGGTAADFAVNGSVGQMTVTAASTFRMAYVAADGITDAEFLATFTVVAATGGSLELEFDLGGQSSLVGTGVRAYLDAGGAVRIAATGSMSVGTTVAGLTHTGAALTFRARIIGSHAYARIWLTSGAEPTVWHYAAPIVKTGPRGRNVDSGSFGIAGVRVGRSAGNTNASPVFSIDNVTISTSHTRFCGQIVDVNPDSDVSRNDRFSTVTLTGGLRRMTRASDLASPLRRTFTTRASALGIAAYWPCEDGGSRMLPGQGFQSLSAGANPLVMQSGISGSPTDAPVGASSIPTWGTSTALASMQSTGGTAWTMGMVLAIPSTIPADVVLAVGYGSGSLTAWQLWLNTLGQIRIQFYTGGGGVPYALAGTFGYVHLGAAFNLLGQVGIVEIQAQNVGADVEMKMRWLEQFAISSLSLTTTVTGQSTTGISNVRVAELGFPLGEIGLGHIYVSNQFLAPYSGADRQLDGWVEEKASARFARLMDEGGFPSVSGSASAVPLGVQPRGTALECIDDAAVDAVVIEDRATGRPAMIPRSVIARNVLTPTVLSESAGTAHPPLLLISDDQKLGNRVTVTRPGGKSAEVSDAASIAARGLVARSASVNVVGDDIVASEASRILAAGTPDDPRASSIVINAASKPSVIPDLLKVDIGTVVEVTDMPSWRSVKPLAFVVNTIAETIGVFDWTLAIEAEPAGPWRPSVVDGASSRWETGGSVLNSAVTNVATTLVVNSTMQRWGTTGEAGVTFPFDIEVRGERMTVTAIAVAALTGQTFTVTRGVNGVAAAHPIGAPLMLWRPGRVA